MPKTSIAGIITVYGHARAKKIDIIKAVLDDAPLGLKVIGVLNPCGAQRVMIDQTLEDFSLTTGPGGRMGEVLISDWLMKLKMRFPSLDINLIVNYDDEVIHTYTAAITSRHLYGMQTPFQLFSKHEAYIHRLI